MSLNDAQVTEEDACSCSQNFLNKEDKSRINEFVTNLLKQQEEQKREIGVVDAKAPRWP